MSHYIVIRQAGTGVLFPSVLIVNIAITFGQKFDDDPDRFRFVVIVVIVVAVGRSGQQV